MRPKKAYRRPTVRTLARQRQWELKRNAEELTNLDESLECVDSNLDTSIVENDEVSGYRIVDLPHVLEWAMDAAVLHSKTCDAKLKTTNERRKGLSSTFTLACSNCAFQIQKGNEKKKTITKKAVLGTIASGSTHATLKHLLGIMEIPYPTFSTFADNEKKIVKIADECLVQSMAKAAAEEKDLAIQKNQVDKDGKAWIRVNVDGSWSKRSYGHSYNAPSGVAVIIGSNTGKILFIGVKNKYCTICARAENLGKEANLHKCFKNWTGSSGTMEAAVIVEGFNNAPDSYELKYLEYVGDGDSSVYAKIRKNCTYGGDVEKIECKNHVIKNYGKHLYSLKADAEKLVADDRRLLSQEKIKALQKIAMKCLYYNANGDVQNLKKDLSNGPNHVFGKHDDCREIYCAMEKSTETRFAKVASSKLLEEVNKLLKRVVDMGDRLIDNETNNKAEGFMALMSKFNAAKRLHLTGRGCYQGRAYTAALCFNEGQNWSYNILQVINEGAPGAIYEKYVRELKRSALQLQERRSTTFPTRRRGANKKKTQKTEAEYGPSVREPPLTADRYETKKIQIMKDLEVSPEEIIMIEAATKDQWKSTEYKKYREIRLTASFFGKVARRNLKTNCEGLVGTILPTRSFKSKATDFGKANEEVARQKFADLHPTLNVQPAGLFVDAQHNYLAATPDGLVDDDGVLEIKCFYAANRDDHTLLEAVNHQKYCCLHVENGNICLKKTHPYYYQIQGQLNIARKNVCYFVVYINDRQPLHVETIRRDEQFWSTIRPKLTDFYFRCLLPRIVDRNRGCSVDEHKRVVDITSIPSTSTLPACKQPSTSTPSTSAQSS